MPNAATTKIHRPPAESKSNSDGAGNPGCRDTTAATETPQNANAGAAQPDHGGAPPDTPPPGDTAAGFLTANGSRDTHVPTLRDGRRNRSPRAGRPYSRITWAGIRALVDAPAAVPKDDAPFVILSTYTEPDARTHAVQRAAGVFGGLAVDVDAGNPALADVLAAVRAVIGDAAAFVYSSASAAPDRRKWRVLVPLATPVAGADYDDTQLALFELLAEHGLACDVALARTGQPVYLPNVPPERRGPDGAPLFYQSAQVDGPALELAGHAIVARRDAARARRAALEVESAERSAAYRSQRLAHVAATGDTFDAIQHFNEHHTVAAMLARYGFERSPRQRGSHWRSPLSQSGSYSTEDRGDHWVAVSSWAHNHNVGRATAGGFRAGDAFDLFVAFEHNGNRSAAVRAYAAEVRPWRPAPAALAPVEDLPPPGRVELLPRPRVVPLETIRETVEDQLRLAVHMREPLAVIRAGTAAAKTTTAVRVFAETGDRIVWNVQSHAAAAQVVAMHHAAGHMDCAAVPPRDETTCRCWRAEDAERVAQEHGTRAGLSMEKAMAVGMPMLACSQCPLSGMVKPRERVEPVEDLAAWADPFGDAPALAEPPAADTRCEYWQRHNHAVAQRIVVQCQQRTERNPEGIAAEGWERVWLLTDENALGVLQPRLMILPEELAAVRDALAAEAANHTNRVAKMRFGEARARAYELARWADAVADVADAAVAKCAAAVAAGVPLVESFTLPAVDPETVPRAPHRKLLALLARANLPPAFTPAAFELCRMLATGEPANATLRVAADAEGTYHASIHRSWALEVDPTVAHIVLDATVDVEALERIRPGVVVFDPPGVAERVHTAVQWWQEINPRTAPAVVVDTMERVLDAYGWQRAAFMLCKSHRDVLFPRTRPRHGQPVDKPATAESIGKAIERWHGAKVSTTAAAGAARERAAQELAARVARIRQRLARDADGNVLVDHHRGTRSRGSNAFMAAQGVDGFGVIGHTRTNPVDIVGYMLATGMADAVAAGDGGWGDVAGELPHVDGGTRTVRWRGYTCPHWAAAARACNRADLEQTGARGRPNLPAGVPTVVVAAEPCGLPLADPPERLPAGVAAVVDAVRRLAAGGVAQVATDGAEPGATVPGESGNASMGHTGPEPAETTGTGADSIGHRSIGHTVPVCLREGWPIENAPPTGLSMDAIAAAMPGTAERSLRRWLADAVARGLLTRTGDRRWTRYALPQAAAAPALAPEAEPPALELPAPEAAPPPAAPAPRPKVVAMPSCDPWWPPAVAVGKLDGGWTPHPPPGAHAPRPPTTAARAGPRVA